MNWDEFYINMAQLVSLKSKDTSTKVGCVLVGEDNEVLSIGYNGMPRGMDDSIIERQQRPFKYFFFEHAERNSLYNALRKNIPVRGATAYLNWEPIPCPDCTRAFIQSGISRIVGPDRPFAGKGNWDSIYTASLPMLKEVGIDLVTITEYKLIVPLEIGE